MMSLALELGSNAGWMTEMPWGQGPPAPSAATKQIIKKPQWQTFWTTAPVILNVILSDVAVLFLMQKRRVISSATLSAPIALVSCTVRRLHWQWQEPGGTGAVRGHSHPSGSSSLELIPSRAAETSTQSVFFGARRTRLFSLPWDRRQLWSRSASLWRISGRGMVCNVNFSLSSERSQVTALGTSHGLELFLNVHQRVTLWMVAWDI